MTSRFQWILSCLDNGSTITLQKDPVGWDTCSYRMERHATYKGIFNQFTSTLKFHRMGGGKQWVDNIYKTFDIDAQVTITVMIDSDGSGVNYDTLFTGRLNFASYSEDGTYTTLNIEQSDIFTKLNTRADIPVPLNVVSVRAGYYNNGNWVGYSFFGTILNTSDVATGSGSWLVNDAFITAGNTYYVQTLDQNSNNLTCQVIFDGISNPNNGAQTDGNTQITINTNIAAGFMQIDYVNLKQPIMIYLAGKQQKSLGQQAITAIPAQTLHLPGIPIQYQSRFTFTDNAQSSAGPGYTFNEAEKYTFSVGQIISVTTQDINGNPVYDQITYTGPGAAGPGMTSSNGLTTIRITHSSATSVTVSFTNVYGPVDLFLGSIGSVNVASPGAGTPPGQNIDTYLPVGSSVVQQFIEPSTGSISINAGERLGGLLTFDAKVIFDNLNEFVFAPDTDMGISPNITTNNSNIASILNGISSPYIEYPVTVNWSVQLKGKMTEGLGAGIDRTIYLDFTLAHGGGATPVGSNALSDPSTTRLSLFHTQITTADTNPSINFDTGLQSGSFNLGVGDQVWLYAYITVDYNEGPLSGVTVPFTFTFDQSDLDFKVTTRAAATQCQTILVHEAFNQVVDSIADSDKNFYSDFYGRTNSAKTSYAADGPGSLRALTNGLCIRGHLDKYISMSLNDIFNSMNAIDNIGLEIDADKRVRVEPLSFFFDRQTQILVLPHVNKYETHNENSCYINQIEVGYDKWETELYFKNGLDEIHAKRIFATKVGAAKGTVLQNYSNHAAGFLKVNGKLTAISKFVAGNYTIELTRRKNLQWSQDDFKYDNDNFILCLHNRYNGGINFQSSNTAFLYASAIQVLPGDTMHVLNAGADTGSYTVAAVTIIGGNSTLVTITGTFPATGNFSNASATFDRSIFPETAMGVLQQPIQNVIDPALSQNWLNMSITPARMLQAHINRVTAGLQIINGKTQFLGGSGNFEAGTQMFSTGAQQDYNGKMLYENASLNWNDSNIRNITPLWLPEIYRFEYPITYRQFKQIKANPNGFITFYKFSNDVKFGFILNMEYQIKTGMTKFELLRMNPPAAIEGVVNEDGTYIII